MLLRGDHGVVCKILRGGVAPRDPNAVRVEQRAVYTFQYHWWLNLGGRGVVSCGLTGDEVILMVVPWWFFNFIDYGGG
ncbi:Hypothetical predicted protein [Olea europaea subsp. europaea]|uniref:Uncharacterized protein n=1 Tax=Olea europaea subsp. europaea TaxID=158383 RepID=A0A8S0UF37_OLEEU|nr:Hypothetical predicted protein [Olea europaea subsp. europaea]